MKALFIGRFQPFHKGHLMLLKSIYKDYDEIIIGVGSSQYSNTLENPFTADERIKMIESSLKKNNINNYKIVLIPDIHNPPIWASHVLSIVPDFNIVLTNNSFTKQLFSEKGYTVKRTQIFEKNKYSGKEIRRRMINDIAWEDLVPSQVAEIIKEVNGVMRLKKMAR